MSDSVPAHRDYPAWMYEAAAEINRLQLSRNHVLRHKGLVEPISPVDEQVSIMAKHAPAAPTPDAEGWIRCSHDEPETLPEYGSCVLVYCTSESGAHWQDIAGISYHGGWGIEHDGVTVTHWRNLPAPPTEGQ